MDTVAYKNVAYKNVVGKNVVGNNVACHERSRRRAMQQSGQAGVELGLRVENAPASDLSQPYVAPAAPEKKDTIDNINNVMNTLNKGVDMIQTIRSFFR